MNDSSKMKLCIHGHYPQINIFDHYLYVNELNLEFEYLIAPTVEKILGCKVVEVRRRTTDALDTRQVILEKSINSKYHEELVDKLSLFCTR